MSNVIIYDRMQIRQGTAADLTSVNEVLLEGEYCLETDTGKLKIGDGSTAWNSLAYQLNVDAPSDGNEYVRKDQGWTIASGGAGDTPFLFCENFLRGVTTGVAGAAFTANEWRPVAYVSGAGAGVSLDSPGALITTGTTTSGISNLFVTAGTRFKPGREIQRYGARIELPILSDASQSYVFNFGLLHTTNGTDTDRIVARYAHGTNSGQWVLRTASASVTTDTNTSVAAVAATEVDLELEINQAATEVNLYVDGALAATSTTNIPSVALGLTSFILKAAGTTARTARIVRMWRR